MKNTTIKSYLFKVLFLLITLVLGISIGIFGMSQYAKKQKAAELQNSAGLITDKIAIVNLDNGVMVNSENVNYAGYLIIPATFSEGVVSLNNTPVRAEITNTINENLIAEVKEQAIYD